MNASPGRNFLRRAPVRAQAALRRFPLVLLAGLAVSIIIMMEPEDPTGVRYLMAAVLAVPTSLAASLLAERYGMSPINAWPLVLAITAVVVVPFVLTADIVSWPSEHAGSGRFRTLSESVGYRFGALLLAAHAAVAVVPWIRRGTVAEFWQYNRRLLLRILAAVLFGAVLYGGLALALWSIDELLTIDIEWQTYRDLFALLLGVFTTWFFTAGMPEPLRTTLADRETVARSEPEPAASVPEGPEVMEPKGLERTMPTDAGPAVAPAVVESSDGAFAAGADVVDTYPRSLKAFAAFVLIPLTVIYLVILYLYLGRIIIEWNLPDGRVALLVFGYSVVGILAYLLVFPLRNDVGNQWIRGFARWFFLALAPLLVLLAVAVLRRTSVYGLTEMRVFALVLAAWLAGITIWFLLRREDIRIIPATLAVVAVLSVVGPWSATAISMRSQLAALERLVATPADTSAHARETYDARSRAISSVVWYLRDRGALEEAAAIVSRRPDTIRTVDDLLIAAGARERWGSDTTGPVRPATQVFQSVLNEPASITGFNRMVAVRHLTDLRADGLRIRWAPELNAIEATGSGGRALLGLGAMVDSLRSTAHGADYVGERPFIVDATSGSLRLRLIATQIRVRDGRVEEFEGILLY